jgi:hypothetical protein
VAQRIDDAGELDEQPVAGGLDDAPLVVGDAGIDQLAAQRLERGQRALLVLPDQPRIAGDIGGQNRRQPPLYPLLGHRVRPDPRRDETTILTLRSAGPLEYSGSDR